MDFKNRIYYNVRFRSGYNEYRTECLKCIDSVTVGSRKGFLLVSCAKDKRASVEYELRKAERRDGYCVWCEINKTNRL